MGKKQIENNMIDRLCNATKGHAQLILLDKNMPDEQRKTEFEVIDEFVQYISNYHENIKKLEEYREYKYRGLDGR